MYELSDFSCRSHVIFFTPKIGRMTLRFARERARGVPVRSCKDPLRNLTVQLFPFVYSCDSMPGVISCAGSSHEMRLDYHGISHLLHIGELSTCTYRNTPHACQHDVHTGCLVCRVHALYGKAVQSATCSHALRRPRLIGISRRQLSSRRSPIIGAICMYGSGSEHGLISNELLLGRRQSCKYVQSLYH